MSDFWNFEQSSTGEFEMGGGDIEFAIGNIENCVAQYGYQPDEVDSMHQGRFTDKDFDLLKSIFMKASVELLKILSHESFAESVVYYD